MMNDDILTDEQMQDLRDGKSVGLSQEQIRLVQRRRSIAAIQFDGHRIEYVDQTRITKRQELASRLLTAILRAFPANDEDELDTAQMDQALRMIDELSRRT